MRGPFPIAEPFDRGILDAGEGHGVHWEACGNPDGAPVVYLHGGPGSGLHPLDRTFFDPAAFRAYLIDQRGAGRSTPPASEPAVDLSANTTQHLMLDLERLRVQERVEDWLVVGVSWGCTLALAYAHAHPERVKGLVLALVTTTSRHEVDWITVDMGRVFPREWDRFAGFVPPHLQHLPLADADSQLLLDPDPGIHQPAAREWCAWEDTHVSLAPGHTPNPQFEDPDYRLRFARLVTHYWRHQGFLEDGHLLRHAARLEGKPGILIHGRHDVSSPLQTAWRLHQGWLGSELWVLGDAGHGGGFAGEALVEGLSQLRAS